MTMLSKGIQKHKGDAEKVYLHVELDWGAQKDMTGAGALPGKRKAITGGGRTKEVHLRMCENVTRKFSMSYN